MTRQPPRATGLAATTGFLGIVIGLVVGDTLGVEKTPGQWLKQIGIGWCVGVLVGLLLAVVVFRLREKEWPSWGDGQVFASSAWVLFVVVPVVAALFLAFLAPGCVRGSSD